MTNISLKEVLKAKPDGRNLSQNLDTIKAKAEPLLSRIIETFPDYTAHDIGHSERVVRALDLIIPDLLKEQLNEYEICFLIAGAYLHDIGMVNFPELIKNKELEEFKEKKRKKNPNADDKQILQDYIRENHHLRSEEFINNNFKDLAIRDHHQARIIGRICRGHRKEKIDNMEFFESDKMYINHSINIPLLASFLRIADELDLTFERIPSIVKEHTLLRDPISKEEWEKHLSISGVGLNPEDSFEIICSAICKNPKIHRALKSLEIKIERELENLPYHIHHYRKYRKYLPREFSMRIQAIGYKYNNIKFSLQEKKIMNLLMGKNIYKYGEESLRELLKNSVDACRLRRELLKKDGLSYSPEIVFEYTPGEDSIIVTDNGVGMDEDIIEQYFIKIGKSFYRSPDFLEKDVDFTPVSELGIGILSCFMIANKIVVDTKTEDSDPLLLEIDDVSDYFVVRKGERKNPGTTVTLFLNDKIKSKVDLFGAIKYYARHLEFPIKVIFPNGTEYAVEDEGFEPDIKDSRWKWNYEDYPYHLIKINDNYIEGVVAIFFEKDEELGLKPIEKLEEFKFFLQRYEYYAHGRFFLSSEGIFINNINILPGWLQKEFVITDLNLKKGALDLNVGRNDIIRNEEFDKLRKRLGRILINDIENLLNEIKQKAKKSKINDSKKLMNRFFTTYVPNFVLGAFSPDPPGEFLNFIKKFYCFKYISKDGIGYVDYGKIGNDKIIVSPSGFKNYDEDHMKHVLSNCLDSLEDIFYLLPGSKTYPIHDMANMLFGDRTIDLLEFLGIKESDELYSIIPRNWKLVRFNNYKTSRFIEFIRYNDIILNRDNRFVDLLIKGKYLLNEHIKIAVEDFFIRLNTDLNSYPRSHLRDDFPKILAKQREILEWLVDNDLIKEHEKDFYILTENDFAPYLMKT